MARHSDSEQEEYSDQYNESEQEYSDNDPMSEDDNDEESDEVLLIHPITTINDLIATIVGRKPRRAT